MRLQQLDEAGRTGRLGWLLLLLLEHRLESSGSRLEGGTSITGQGEGWTGQQALLLLLLQPPPLLLQLQ